MAAINAKIKPDVVVITGDIIDNGDDIAALKQGAEIIRRLKCPVIIAKGDHDIARKPDNRGAWESAFGELDGSSDVRGFAFFYIPFESNKETFKRLEHGIKAALGKKQPLFLCEHRMLYPSWLMSALCKRWHRTELLSPDRDTIMGLLGKTATPWIVLCGHSHTNHKATHGNVTEFCTSSLAEYPHELRILKIKEGKVWTTLVRMDELGKQMRRE
ncbi:MAG: metallophosphoesterase [Kiritimatiellia bacterium]